MRKKELKRMLELSDIKPVIKESKMNLLNFELVKGSVDGNTYAIVKENKKYFIKCAATKDTLSESDFDYIGGLANKTKKSFTSFEKTTRHLNLIFEEINNHYDVSNINILESELLDEKKFVLKMKKKKTKPVQEPSFKEPSPEEGEEEFDFESEEGDDFDFESEEGDDFDFESEEGDESVEEFDFESEGEEESVEEFGEEGEEDLDLDLEDSDDEIKDIQSMTGKLGQQLRDTEDISSDMQKWVAKSVLSALNLDNMDSEDKKDIIRAVKKDTKDDDEVVDVEEESVEESYGSYMGDHSGNIDQTVSTRPERPLVKQEYNSYMEDDFNEKEYNEWLSDMETSGIIEPSVGEYDDYDSYMGDVNEMDVAVGDANSGEYPIGRAAWESEEKSYKGGDEDDDGEELLLDEDDYIDDDPYNLSNHEAEALYGPKTYDKNYSRKPSYRAEKQASKDISNHYNKFAAPGYELEPSEKWRKHKLPYNTEFMREYDNIEDELGLPPCVDCDESSYMSEAIDSLNNFYESYMEDNKTTMSPEPQRTPEKEPSQPKTKPGAPDKTPGKDRPSRRPFSPPPEITPGEEPGPKAGDDSNVEFE